jgi:hypothetical protein
MMVYSKNLFVNYQLRSFFDPRRGDVRSLSECVGPLTPTMRLEINGVSTIKTFGENKCHSFFGSRRGGQLSAPTVQCVINGILGNAMTALKGGA